MDKEGLNNYVRMAFTVLIVTCFFTLLLISFGFKEQVIQILIQFAWLILLLQVLGTLGYLIAKNSEEDVPAYAKQKYYSNCKNCLHPFSEDCLRELYCPKCIKKLEGYKNRKLISGKHDNMEAHRGLKW